MKNKLLILIFILFLLNISIINAADNAVVSHEVVQDAENTIKVLFLSWGEGLTTTIDLDEYFLVKRDQNTQYLYLSPKEIIVSIDQATGVATLKESKGWIGSKEIYFSISDIYHLYETQTALRKYVEKIQKERESETIKTNLVEFKDSSLYPYLDSLLNKLDREKSSTETPEIKVIFQKPDLKIDVGSSINFNIGIKTKTSEGIKTYLPYLILNIKPEKQIVELEQAGFSFWILAPLIIIILVLAVILYFYIKNNIPSIKRFINKIIPAKKKTRVDVLSQDVKNLKSFSLELRNLLNQINNQPEKKLSEQYFDITKKFFNSLTHPAYQFTYAEIIKEIIKEDINDELKGELVIFSKELSDLRFSGKRITKPEILSLINKTQSFIDKVILSKQKTEFKEYKKILKKSFWIHFISYIKTFFKEEEKTGDEKLTKEKFSKKYKLFKKFLELINISKKKEIIKERFEEENKFITKAPKEIKKGSWLSYKISEDAVLLLLLEKFNLTHLFEKPKKEIKEIKEFVKAKKLSEKDLETYFPLTNQEIKNLSGKIEETNKIQEEQIKVDENIKNGMILLFGSNE